MTLAPGTLVRQAAEQDFKHAYEILPRATTARWFESVELGDAFHQIFHSSRLEALREAFAEEFQRGILRQSEFTADLSFDLQGVAEPAPLVPLNENDEGVLDGITYHLDHLVRGPKNKYRIGFIGKLDKDYVGVYSAEKILMFVWGEGKGAQKLDAGALLADSLMNISLISVYLRFLQLREENPVAMGEGTPGTTQAIQGAHDERVRPYAVGVDRRLAGDRPGHGGQAGAGIAGRVDMLAEGTLWGAGLERYRCFPRFEVLKRESPESFIHFFKTEDITMLLQQWQSDLPHILSETGLGDWSARATRDEQQQVADYFNFYGARRLKQYLEKWDQLPSPLPRLGRILNLRDAFDFLLGQVHPEMALYFSERLPLF